MEFRTTTPSRIFPATGGGAGLNFQRLCSHGTPTISMHLFSEHDDTGEDIGIILPTCAAPDLFGAALASIHVALGKDAADEFMQQLLNARDEGIEQFAAGLAERAAARAACCEAGFLTKGREHTCRPDTTPSA
ncbi:hypothetical protein [Streptomyces sp. NPDC001508]|uniref:hypothetical protein n=1 Tax=Streptomyces sp. NPDC001508 TaxID=3154656 RepID=UPI003322A704